MSARMLIAGGLLAAMLVGAFYLLASTGLRATRGEVVEATRARLTSEAGRAAVRAERAVSRRLAEAVAAKETYKVTAGGGFVIPTEPLPFEPHEIGPTAFPDHRWLLESAERREGQDPENSAHYYRTAAKPDTPEPVRRLALARLAALAARRGSKEEALAHWLEVARVAGDTELLLTAAAEGAPVPESRLIESLVKHLGSGAPGVVLGYARILGLQDEPRVAKRRAEVDFMARLRPRIMPWPAEGRIRLIRLEPAHFAFQRGGDLLVLDEAHLRELLPVETLLPGDPPAAGAVVSEALGVGPLAAFRFVASAGEDQLDAAVRRQAAWLIGAAGLAAAAAFAALTVLFLNVKKSTELASMKTEFVARVSHELRTPLALIRLYAESLRRGRVPEDERCEYAAVVEREAEALNALIDRVLDFSAIERGAKEYRKTPADLAPLIRKAGEEAEVRWPDLHLTVECPESPVPAVIDEAAIRGAVENLIDNAAKHGGGEVTLRLTPPDGDAHRLAEIAVLDRGPGVPADEARLIFDRFYRGRAALRDAVRGSGLGLTLVRHAAEGHGGKAGHRARPDGGSVFTLSLSTEDDG